MYVRDGGVVEPHAASASPSDCLLQLPGGGQSRWDLAGENQLGDASHPVTAVVPSPFSGNWASQTSFSDYPAEARVLSTTPGGAATLLEYRLGNGLVLASGQPLEFAWARDWQNKPLLSNMLRYAASYTPLLAATPVDGELGDGASAAIVVTVNASGWISGTYTTELRLRSDDVQQPEMHVPVKVTVLGVPQMDLDQGRIDFGTVFIGHPLTHTLRLTNTGSAELRITGIASSVSGVSVQAAPDALVPGQVGQVIVQYVPQQVGSLEGRLRIETNAGAATLNLTGEAVEVPVIAITPEEINLNVAADTMTTHTLTLANTGQGVLTWSLEQPTSGSLTEVVASLDEQAASLSSLIPNRYDFTEGEEGSWIWDGGDDMYDGGNQLSTNLGGPIVYDSSGVGSSPAFGGEYVTRKYPGLFVLVADLKGVDSFTIDGDLGADGGGQVEGRTLESTVNGRTYLGLVKRVYGAGDPSVNHLVIVEPHPGVSHHFSANSNDDGHSITGLASTTRLYYLLYASSKGGFVDDQATLAIMQRFLGVLPSDRVSIVSAQRGTLSAGSGVEVEIGVDATGLASQTVESSLTIHSNDPTTPVLTVPLHIAVADSPTQPMKRHYREQT